MCTPTFWLVMGRDKPTVPQGISQLRAVPLSVATGDPAALLELLQVGLDAFELAKAAFEAYESGALDTALAAGMPPPLHPGLPFHFHLRVLHMGFRS